MEHITRSRAALAFLVAAALVFVLGLAFEVAAFATLTPANIAMSTDFAHASDWLRFAGGLIALIAVCGAGWELVLRRSWVGAAEIGAGALGTLLFVIGLLISATTDRSGTSANVVGAIGIGVWSLLVLSRAARRSLGEEQSRSAGLAVAHQAVIWLAAAAGLLLFAVGSGFALDLTSTSIGITSGALQAAGAGVLLGAVVSARTAGYLVSRAVPVVLAGLGLLVAAGIAVAIVSGLVLGPDATLTGIRTGVSVAVTVQLLAVAALGIGAWLRLGERVIAEPAAGRHPVP